MTTTTALEMTGAAFELAGPRTLNGLPDAALVARLKSLVKIERKAAALTLAHLIEFDRRRLYAPLGFGSLFAYCVAELGYSEDIACKRINVARAAARFPMILDMLAEGRLHLTGLELIGPHLTPENCDSLLAQSCGKSKRELDDLVAALAPETEARDLARAIAPGRILVRFCASAEFRTQLERARDALRHKHPEGRFEDALGEALELLLSQQDLAYEPSKRQRRGLRRTSLSRHVPKWIKHLVWKRDGGRCAYSSPDGRRCEERAWLEFDHIVPWALGGSSIDQDNIRLLCWTHNQMAARETFGAAAVTPPPKRQSAPARIAADGASKQSSG